MTASIEILIEEEGWNRAISGLRLLTEKTLHQTLAHLNLDTPFEISVVLSNDASIQVLNKIYRGKDKPTNVLSFPQDDPVLLGDIILALETLQREADEQQKPLEGHFQHLLVHGLLHLLGHDHETDEEAAEMEGLEIKICKTLGLPSPYETDDNTNKTVA